MFREDFRVRDEAGPSHLGHGHCPGAQARPATAEPAPEPAAAVFRRWPTRASPGDQAAAPVPEPAAAAEAGPIVWTGRRPQGVAQDPVLCPRQGPAQHGTLRGRPRPRLDHAGDALRCQSAFRPLIPASDPGRRGDDGPPPGGWAERASAVLAADIPGLELSYHAASDWAEDPGALARFATTTSPAGDIVVASMLFMEDHIQAVAAGPGGAAHVLRRHGRRASRRARSSG